MRKITIKPKNIDFYNLSFEFTETKVMFESNYANGKWDEGKLIPFGLIEISPAACILNYGQGLFEGMKALRSKDGSIMLFRPRDNARRINKSADRILMPRFDESRFIEAIKKVIKLNEDYLPPRDSGGALYIRPLMIGSGPMLGVAPAREFKFIIFVSPVGPYFPDGFKGIDLLISRQYFRACPGGTGYSKTCSNYVGTMKPAKEAKNKGYDQVLYLDSVRKEYINEVGAANFCAVINDKLITPSFDGTILEGITLKSILELAEKKLGMKVEQRNMSYKELFSDNCTETFCTGTAAVITPIKSITMENEKRMYNQGKPGKRTTEFYKLLTSIQYGDIPDEFDWIMKI